METCHSQIGRSIPKHRLMHTTPSLSLSLKEERGKKKRIDGAWITFLVILPGNLGQSISRLEGRSCIHQNWENIVIIPILSALVYTRMKGTLYLLNLGLTL